MKIKIEAPLVMIAGQQIGQDAGELIVGRLETDPQNSAVSFGFCNKSAEAVRLERLSFSLSLEGFSEVTGLRVYREGWTMASACGSARFGESDFKVDNNYQKFCVADSAGYQSDVENKFTSHHLILLKDEATNKFALAGFITSAEHLTNFEIELASSGVTSFTANCLHDGALVYPGEAVSSEELVLLVGDDGYALLQEFAGLWAKRMKALTWDHVPTGWCSWYYYFDKVTEKDIVDNIDFISANKDQFPLEYIQLDDGYQAALGDWLECNEKFPNGIKYLADKSHEHGFKFGLWSAPFMVEKRSRLFREHPDWMVKDENGEVMFVSEWRGEPVAVLDGTHPQALQYLYEVYSKKVEWGVDYIKIDFLVWACAGKGGCYYDKRATRGQAFRRGLQAIRNAMGDKFILGCTTPLGQVVGLVNGERISTDITPYWQPDRKIYDEAPTVYNVCRNVINRAYMNGRLWISDPDTHIARIDNNKLTGDEVLLWTYALFMTGGMLLLSDNFITLDSGRAELSKMLIRNNGIFRSRPLDLFERQIPAIWLCEKENSRYVGFFNFNDDETTYSLGLSENNLSDVSALKDHISGGSAPEIVSDKLTCTLKPHACRIFEVC